MSVMFRSIIARTYDFARQNSGSVTIMTTIMLPTLLLLAGGATDISRAHAVKAQAQRTLDAAVLSMARSGMDDDEIRVRGPEMFAGWLQTRDMGDLLVNSEFTANSTGAARGAPDTVMARASLSSPTYFLNLFGRDTLEIDINSSSLKPNALPYEISLVLDVSGSMTSDLNGRPRIDRLKEATISLLDLVEEQSLSATPPTISVVPYSKSINLGDLPSGVLSGTSINGGALPAPGDDVWAAERFRGETSTGYTVNDASPYSSALPFLTTAELGNGRSASRLAQPTQNPASYRASIAGLEVGGYTSGHLGMIWGLYVLSPNWSSVWSTDPKPYGEAEKVIVMMTDGKFNTTHNIGEGGVGDTENSIRYFNSACDLAKENGIIIYTVTLMLDEDSEDLLRACAAGSGGEMFSADSAASLVDAFEEIAKSLGRLRLAS